MELSESCSEYSSEAHSELEQCSLVRRFEAISMDCAQCPLLLARTQSCPVAGPSVLVACMVALSVLPYLLILLYLLLFCLRSSAQVKTQVLAGVVTSAFALVIKEVVQQDRPEGACTHSYGMPSNHVALMASFAVVNIWLRPRPWLAFCMVAMVLSEACSRVYLNYHTPTQCLAGILLGSLSTLGCLGRLSKDKAS